MESLEHPLTLSDMTLDGGLGEKISDWETAASPVPDTTLELIWKTNCHPPANSPAAADHGVAPLSAMADVDIDLEQVFGDVGSLPAMVTPICDLDV